VTDKIVGTYLENTSTNTPLGSGETYTGRWTDVRIWDTISFAVRADQECTIYADFTADSTFAVVDSSLTYKVTANINEVHRLTITRPFFRLRIVNGSSEQSYLSVSAMSGTHPQLSAPMNLNLGLDSDAIAVRPTIPEDEAVISRRPGITPFTKFGYREGLTAANGEETIWETTGNFTPMTTASTFTITYNNSTDGLGTTGALSLFIVYIDENGLKAESVHTLSNTGSDVTSFSGLGINRIAVSATGAAQTNTNTITVTETTGATKQAVIPAGQSVTQQAIYFTDSNSYAVGKMLWIHCNKISGGGSPRILIKGYVFNRNVATRYEIFRVTIDTSTESHVNLYEDVGFRLTPTDVLYFVADTDTNNSAINVRFSLREYKID